MNNQFIRHNGRYININIIYFIIMLCISINCTKIFIMNISIIVTSLCTKY